MTGDPLNPSAHRGLDARPPAAEPAPHHIPHDLNAPALLRAHADRDLPDSHPQTAALRHLLTDPVAARDAGIPDPHARVEFERSLRAACGRCLCSMAGGPSSDLRARIQALAAQHDAIAHPPRASTNAPAPIPGRAHAGVRRPTRRWAMSLGATAILVFAAAAIYQAVINAGTVRTGPESFTAQVASFISLEHQRTALNTDAAKAKFGCTDAARVCADFSQTLGESPDLPALGGEHDLTFQGAGPCGVPGGPSIHARFYTRHDAQGHDHEMSLFVQRDTGRLDLEEGRVYSLECAAANVDVWRHGSLIYYLVSDEHGCDCFRRAAGVGAPSGTVRVKDQG